MGSGKADATDRPKFFKDDKQVIFNKKESAEDKLNYLYRFNFNYILLDPEYYSLSNIFDEYSCFQKVYDKDDFALFKIDRAQLELTLLNWEE